MLQLFILLIMDKLSQLLECVEYSKEECLMDMVALVSGMKKCGDSYEAEWISHRSVGLIQVSRKDSQLLLWSL